MREHPRTPLIYTAHTGQGPQAVLLSYVYDGTGKRINKNKVQCMHFSCYASGTLVTLATLTPAPRCRCPTGPSVLCCPHAGPEQQVSWDELMQSTRPGLDDVHEDFIRYLETWHGKKPELMKVGQPVCLHAHACTQLSAASSLLRTLTCVTRTARGLGLAPAAL